jgi:1,4-alpha-glucan branching enzyme
MKTGTMVPYAHKRIKNHINRFMRLHHDIQNSTIDPDWLSDIESKDNIFSHMDCAKYYLDRIKTKELASKIKGKEKCLTS